MLMKKTEDLPDIMMMRKITTENDRKRNHLRMIRRKEDRKRAGGKETGKRKEGNTEKS